jgi:hypothetical protein
MSTGPSIYVRQFSQANLLIFIFAATFSLLLGCENANRSGSNSKTIGETGKRLLGKWEVDKAFTREVLLNVRQQQIGKVTDQDKKSLDEKLKTIELKIEFRDDGTYELVMKLEPSSEVRKAEDTWEANDNDNSFFLIVESSGTTDQQLKGIFLQNDLIELKGEAMSVPFLPDEVGMRFKRVE